MNAVIFDIDGTLLESAAEDDHLYRQTVIDVLGAVRMRPSMRDYNPVTDTAILEQIAADNRLTLDDELLNRVRDAFCQRIAEHIDVEGPFTQVAGADRFLRLLHASPDAAVAIATGGWAATARLKLETAGLVLSDVPIVSSDDARARTDIMRIALNSLEGPFDKVVYVGDGHWDRRATAGLGWIFQPVGSVLGGISSFDELRLEPEWRWLYNAVPRSMPPRAGLVPRRSAKQPGGPTR